LYTPNDPIIESSDELIFAPYNFKYPHLEKHAESANIIGEFKDDYGKTLMKQNKWN
jgi:hypothetical protein